MMTDASVSTFDSIFKVASWTCLEELMTTTKILRPEQTHS
jgi:hypothetical protein